MKATLFIAKRYLFSKSKQTVINVINLMTLLVLVIGGASLMIVLSGFAGLKDLSLSFSTFFDPDLKILPKEGKTLYLTPEIISQIAQDPNIIAHSKVIEEKIFLQHKGKSFIAQIKGVDEHYPKVNVVDSILMLNPKEWLLTENYVIVGEQIARALHLSLYSTESVLELIAPKTGKGSIINNAVPYRQEAVLLSDYYKITEELDNKYVFATEKLAQSLLGLAPNEYSAIELRIAPNTEKTLREKLPTLFPQKLTIKNRQQINADLYKMFNTEHLATYLIFTLVLVIALFNLVGAIIMMILDKKQDLQTLRALGLEEHQLKEIFFLQGVGVSFTGAMLGVGAGLLIAWLQKTFHFLHINPNALSPVPYPMTILWSDVLLVFLTIFLLGSIASFIGSRKIG